MSPPNFVDHVVQSNRCRELFDAKVISFGVVNETEKQVFFFPPSELRVLMSSTSRVFLHWCGSS